MVEMGVEIQVAFTMDCERIASESPPGGPGTWELSERAIEGYCGTLLEEGFPPTLFIVPECAQRHRELFLDLASRGVELGMHLHPQSFADHRYGKYLGEYSRDAQAELIGEAMRAFTVATGVIPQSFRSGNFSASDDTYSVLSSLGFRQGSVSDPGRDAPGFAAVWRGACQDPHWASQKSRLESGGLPFLEVPVTTDPGRLQSSGFPWELRVESGDVDGWHRPVIELYLERVRREGVEVPCLCIFTHNFFDYSDPGTSQSSTLGNLVQHLRGLPGVELVPTTLFELRETFLGKVGDPKLPAPG